MIFLKANTAVDVLIGPFVALSDGYTPDVTASITVELSKNGQALAAKNDVTAPTHDAAGTIDGYYNCELDATDTNTEGALKLVAYDATCLPVFDEYMVLSEAAYDSLFTAKDSGYMDVNVKALGDTIQTANDIGADVQKMVDGIITGTVTSTTHTTTQISTSGLPTLDDNELVGRLITFTGGAAEGQQSTITASTAAGVITFIALVTSTAENDTFKIT
jgi:hypothetical protein